MRILMASLATAALAAAALAQSSDWTHYGGNNLFQRYAPLDQITPANVDNVELVWEWDSGDDAIEPTSPRNRPSYFKGTPLVVDGMMYIVTPLNRIAALDPATGALVWMNDPKAYERGEGRGSGFQHRGLAYWRDGDDARIYLATKTRQLVAVDAKTGEPCEDFGAGGWVDLAKGYDRKIDERQLGFNAPPLIVADTIVLGSLVPDEASNFDIPPGDVRGFDVRTGEQKWIFHTIPHPGEFGHDTWKDGSWEHNGAANVWSMMSADDELGYVYFPTGTPSNDFYGGHRVGDNLFAESVVCLNAATGERVWHFQGVHHGLWDYDFPAAPILGDITVEGKDIKALIQVSKQGFVYVLDRRTGEPVWPIEERPVPQSDVPGEVTSPTQPFPTKPAPFELQGITEDDLIDFTPELRQEALDYVKDFTLGPLFTPPSLVKERGTGGVIQVPGAAGGANWGSAAFDPETGYLYVQSATQPSVAGLVQPDPNRSRFKYLRGGPWLLPPRKSGLPLTKPPYGRVTAYDLNTGDIEWQVAHGEGPRDHPLLKDLDLPRLGAPSNTWLSNSGPVVTKTMVIYSHVEVNPDGSYNTDRAWLLAYDKKTGDLLWEEKLPLPPYAVPMSYMHEGKQYITVAAGGAGMPSKLLTYALP